MALTPSVDPFSRGRLRLSYGIRLRGEIAEASMETNAE